MKIWSPDGTVLYSDEPRLIGQQFELDEDELELLETGGSRAEVERPVRAREPVRGRRRSSCSRSTCPCRPRAVQPLLFEAYFHYDGVAAAGRDVWLRFAPYWLGALVLLELLQVPLAISMARRLRRTQHEREELLRGMRSTRRTRSADGSPATSMTASCRTWPASRSRSARWSARTGRPPAESAEIRQAADRVRDGVRSLRSLLVEIYPPNLYDEGLEAVLSDLLARLEPRGIEGTLVVEAPLERLDLDRTQLIYRVAQEGLRNVIAHADANRGDGVDHL